MGVVQALMPARSVNGQRAHVAAGEGKVVGVGAQGFEHDCHVCPLTALIDHGVGGAVEGAQTGGSGEVYDAVDAGI